MLFRGQPRKREQATRVIEEMDQKWTHLYELARKAKLSIYEMRQYLAIAKRSGIVENRSIYSGHGTSIPEWRKREEPL